MKILSRILLYIVVLSGFYSCSDSSQKNAPERLYFEKIEDSRSGITFVNTLKEDVTTKENLFDYDYFYNGAGVAAIDINNDDLPDLLFTANQQENRLYLNKGDFRFEDITESAGINIGKKWSNGVTVVDINDDGYDDLYISQGGPYNSTDRRNLLFVNNGDQTFTEVAATYGLADQGISTQAAFFDYDLDGDLDCIVMNESTLYGYDPVTFQRSILERPMDYYESFSHLYRNDNGQFTDISKQAGINKPTFGLGLSISDVNGDGYPDIYIANDYFLPDNLYINRKNGTFADRIKVHVNHTSFYGMGVDIADVNNDGFQDIFVLDMASQDHVRSKTLMASMDVESFSLLTDAFGYAHQYMFNSLHLNNQQGRFANISHMAQVAKTDWSWAALMEDLDLDGHRDIFITNGYRKYALDNDFKAQVNRAKEQYNWNVPSSIKQELYDEMPTEALPNIVYRNKGDLKFDDIAADVGLDEATYSNGATLVDLDLDGDLDIVVNNIDQKALIYRNNASDIHNYLIVETENPILSCSKIEIHYGNEMQLYEPQITRGYRSAMLPKAHFGLGDTDQVDSLLVYWRDGSKTIRTNVRVNQSITVNPDDATAYAVSKAKSNIKRFAPAAIGLNYRHVENEYNDFESEILLPQKQSTNGPCISKSDLNNDGIEDLYLGGASGQAGMLYLSSGGSYQLTSQSSFLADAIHEDVDAVFFDIDSDGDNDLFVMSGGNEEPVGSSFYQDRLYLNEGNGQFERGEQKVLDELRYSGGVVKAFDYDLDGDMDLIIGNRIIPQSYPKAAPSYLLSNDQGTLTDVTLDRFPALQESKEIINDIQITDINGDDQLDIITVGEWSGIHIHINHGGKFSTTDQYQELNELTGWWYSITETDVNNDRLSDYVVGNVGLNLKHKATKKKPFKIYAEDFDETGSLDIVLTSHYKNEEVPVRGRECSSQQMPFIADKFKSYNEFANASIIDIYGSEQVSNAYAKEAVSFESVVLIGTGSGDFRIEPLPAQAQAFPILDATSVDVNGDNGEDLIVTGNIYNTEVETPRLDGGSGLVLLSDGQAYTVADCPEYCFYSPGNVKRLSMLQYNDQSYLIALVNDGPLSMFQMTN